MVPPNCLSKIFSGGQREEGHGVVHHLQQEHHQSMKEGFHKKVQKIRMVQNGHPYLSIKKKFRWTARGRTGSSPPSSARTSAILLDAPFSKCQGMTRKYWGPTTQPTTPNHPPKPNQPLINQLEVLEPSLGLDLIDSQSSQCYNAYNTGSQVLYS